MVETTKSDQNLPITGELSPRQTLILSSLLSGKSIEATARELRISTQTVDGNLRKPEFRSALRAGQDAVFTAAITRLTALSQKAMTAIETVLDSKTARDTDKIAAAKVVLTVLIRYRDSDIIERLASLEQALQEMENG